ncbi:endolysin [Mycobacterium phage MOOREtheMARYer]|uniref:Tape measure protein n=1 Tax=Mycobacterium phage MOOREtheMARYer TaxID=1647309 RepID=A0A0F6SJV5_9CAUD|nr:endolysin [Mycobacterium phage MOOREtheMARYer]AKF14877.1 tape measure protein [Mycobacterium phage MOOREtheMARYer]
MQGTYWLTVLPETSQLRPRIKRALRGIDDDARVTPTVDDRGAEKSGKTFGEKFRKGFERSGASKLGAWVGAIGIGIRTASDHSRGLVRNIGSVALGLSLASKVARGLSVAMLGASLGLKRVAGVGLGKLATGLGFTATQAGRAAKAIGQVTASLLVLMTVAKVIGTMTKISKVLGALTIGGAALLGVMAALTTTIGQGLVSALMAAGAAAGVAVGALVGIMGPAIAVAKIGFKGLEEGAKAFADTMKDVWGPADEAFNKMVGQRMAPLLTSFRDLKMAVTDVFSNALTPAFKSLGGLMDTMKPRFTALAGDLGALGSEVAGALASPANTAAFQKMFDASDRFFANFLGESGISGALGGLIQFVSTAADTFAGVGKGLNEQLLKFGEWLRGITPGQMTAAFAALKSVVMSVWNVVKPIITFVRDLGTMAAPALAPGFQALGQALGQAGPPLMRMAEILMPALSSVMERLSPIIPELVRAFTPWAGVLAQIAPPIASIVAQMAPLAPLLVAGSAAVKLITVAMVAGKAAGMAFSVMQGVAAAATGASTASLGGNVIALGAHRVATVASTIASRALGVAMTFALGPIGLIIAAVVAVGAAIWAFFTKTETGKRLWEKIWPAITNAVKVAWTWIKDTFAKAWQQIGPSLMRIGATAKDAFGKFVEAAKTVWTAIQPAIMWIGKLWLSVQKFNFTVAIGALKALGAVIGWLWTNVVVPAFKGIALAVETWWAGVQIVWAAAQPAIRAVGDVIMWLWQNVAVPAFDAIKTAVTTWWDGVQHVWGLFKTGVDTVGNAITFLKDAFTTGFNAIKGVVEKVWGFIGGILDKIKSGIGGVVDKLNSIPGIGALIPGNADGRPPGFAGGTVSRRGVVSGPGTGTSDSILARISNGEGIVKERAMAAGGGVLVAALNAGWTPTAEQMHQLFPGFAEGLNPGADWMRRTIMETFPQIKTIGGRRSEDGYGEHSSGNAMDIMIPDYQGSGKALGDQIASWIAQNRDALGANGMIWRQTSFGYGGDWTSGKTMSDRGSDTQNHMDHIHVILGEGRGAGAASVDVPSDSVSLARSLGGGSSSSGATSLGSSTSAGGSYRAATDKELAASSNRLDNATRAVEQAQQRVDDRTYARDKAQARLDKLRAEGKDTADAQHSLDVANRELKDATDAKTRATEKAARAEQDDAALREQGVEDLSSAKDSAGGGGGFDDLGKSLWGGLMETIGLDGSVFSNPFEWPMVKSAMAGVNWLGKALLGDEADQGAGAGGGGTDLLGGVLSGAADTLGVDSLNPANNLAAPATNVAPDTTQHGAGGGQAPGPAVVIEQAGMSPQSVANTLDAQWNARTRTTKVH